MFARLGVAVGSRQKEPIHDKIVRHGCRSGEKRRARVVAKGKEVHDEKPKQGLLEPRTMKDGALFDMYA